MNKQSNMEVTKSGLLDREKHPQGRWECQNPKCKAIYTEYVNGCPKCATGDPGGSHKVVLNPDTIPNH